MSRATIVVLIAIGAAVAGFAFSLSVLNASVGTSPRPRRATPPARSRRRSDGARRTAPPARSSSSRWSRCPSRGRLARPARGREHHVDPVRDRRPERDARPVFRPHALLERRGDGVRGPEPGGNASGRQAGRRVRARAPTAPPARRRVGGGRCRRRGRSSRRAGYASSSARSWPSPSRPEGLDEQVVWITDHSHGSSGERRESEPP